MSFQMIFVMRFSQVTFSANSTSILSKALGAVQFVVNKFHMSLVENPPAELNIANFANVR